MAKIRIFQIAKELNISHTDILNFLKSKKINVTSHMSPVDEGVNQVILEEFAKDKQQVERFRKEQVRKEIKDVRLKERQASGRKLELLSLNKQREIEKREIKNKEIQAEEKKNLEEWLKRGNHANMKWMEKRKNERGDIKTYFPEAKSVISVGMNYYTGTD